MDWFAAALISAFALSGQALFFQRLQKLYPITTYMTYVWLGAALLLAMVFLRPDHFDSIISNAVPLVLAGVSSWGGIYAYNQSLKTQNNLGYIEAVIAIRTAVTYIYSIFAFQALFDLIRLLGVLAITVGVLAVAEAFPLKRNIQTSSEPTRQPTRSMGMGWLAWAFVAAGMFTAMTIFVRYATDGGARAEVSIVVVLIVAGVLFLAWSGWNKTSLKIARPHIWIVVGAILFATIGNVADFISFERTPNLAYSIAISNTRMIILYILGMLLFSERLQRVKALGIILTFIGVILLS